MSSFSKFAKSTGIYFLGNVLTKMLAFLLLPIYTKYISPEGFGYYDLSITYQNIITTFIFIEIWSAIMRFMFDFDKVKEKYKVIFNGLVIFVGSFVIYVTISIILCNFVHIEYAVYIFIYGTVTIIQNLYSFIARGFGKNALFALSGIVGTLVNLICNIILILVFKMDFKSLYISFILGSMVQVIIMEISIKVYSNIKIEYYDKNIIKNMLKFSLPLSFNSLCYWFLTGFNRIVISHTLGLYENGIFAVANKFAVALSLVTTCFSLAWQETAYNKDIDDNNRGIFYTKASNYYIKFLFTSILIIIPATKILFPYFVDSSYSQALNIIPLFFLATLASIYSSFLGNIFGAEKSTGIIFVSTLVASITNVGVILILIKPFGLQAANISLIFGFLINIIMRLKLLRRKIKISIDIKFIILAIGLFSIVCLVYYKFGLIANSIVLLAMICLMLILFKDLIKIIFNEIKNKIND